MDLKNLKIENYRPAPFWFLNHELEENELRRQIGLMKEAGCSGFFMHPRAGLKTPYGSKKWFELIKAAVEEAEQQGVKAWLYDEDPFPSGIAGGKVVFDHPEFVGRSLTIHHAKPGSNNQVEIRMGPCEVLSAVAVKRDENGEAGEVIDLRDQVGILREHYFKTTWNSSYYATVIDIPYPHYRAETFYPEMVLQCELPDGDWEVFAATLQARPNGDKYGVSPDNLNPDCVKYFIETTHRKYQKWLGEHFGKTVPGIFTDEPYAGSSLPWTGKLTEEFRERNGYNFIENCFHLVSDFGDKSARVREDYWNTVHHIFVDSFYKQIHNWCRQRRILTTGHVICEEDPVTQAGCGGNVYAFQKYFDIPGFDVVTPRISDSTHPVLNFGGKLVSSAARQQGKKRVLSECFACGPWNYGTESMLKTANWLFAIGITWLVPHGFFYSIDGDRKNDAGKAFSFQDPNYDKFPWFADYAARTGAILAESKHEVKTAVLYQVSSFISKIPAHYDEAYELRDRFYDVMKQLICAHVEFDFIDEETVLASEIRDGTLICGKESYSSFVIPLPDELGKKGKACIEKLNEKSVNVIEADAEGKFVEEVKNSGIWTEILPARDGSKAEELMVLRKSFGDDLIVYVFNNSPKPGWFKLTGAADNFGYVFDAGTGEYLKAAGKGNDLDFAIAGYKALILVLSSDDIATDLRYEMPQELEETVLEAETAPELEYIPAGENISAISNWDIQAGDKEFKNHIFCLIRDIMGTELPHIRQRYPRPGMDTASMISSPYPVKAEFSSKFTVNTDSAQHKLIFESETISGNAELEINGTPVDLGKARRELVYDPFNMVIELYSIIKKGENEIKIRFNEAGEFDGLRSLFYVVPAE